MVTLADDKFGRIDGLVNCAADTTRGEWTGENKATVELLDRQYALNFRAPFLVYMRKTVLFSAFCIPKKDQFTKTASGQT